MRLFILFFIFYHTTSIAQLTNSVYPKSPYSALSVVASSGDYIYSSGTCGLAMATENGGDTWLYFEPEDRVIDIKIVPNSGGEKAYFVQEDGLYIYSIITQEYTKVTNDNLQLSAGKLLAIKLKGDQIYLISRGNIHKASIGIYEWVKTTNFEFNDDYIISTDMSSSYIWVGSDKGKLIKVDLSDDSYVIAKDFGSNIRNIEMATDQLGYAVVSGKQYLLKTIDGGSSFVDLDKMIETISPLAIGENIIMTINTNRVYVSKDGGMTATIVPIKNDGYSNNINGYTVNENDEIILVGKSNMIMKTSDLFQSFTHFNAYKRDRLWSNAYNDDSEAYFIGGAHTILRTTDNGITWTAMDWDLGEVSFLDDIISLGGSKFLLGHGNGSALIDNGAVIKSNETSIIKMLKSIQSGNIVAIRNPGSGQNISISNDEGSTWTSPISLPRSVYTMDQSKTGKIFIPGEKGTLITSTDGGDQWSIEHIGGMEELEIASTKFLNDNVGLLSAKGKLYLTIDGGQSTIKIASGYGLKNLHIFSDKHFMYSVANGNKTTISESTDQGNTWEVTGAYCMSTDNSFYDGDKTVWLGQEGGHINKHIIKNISGNSSVLENSPIGIYPNPIVIGGSLRFEAKDFDPRKADIYNITGQKLSSFNIDNKQDVDISKLGNGIYILELSNDKNHGFAKFIVQ